MIRRILDVLGVNYAYMMEYRAELVMWALANSLPFILMGAWMKASEAGHVALSPVEVARYFLVVFIVRQLTVVWVIWEFESDVVRGRLARYLLTPVEPALRYLASHVAERGARLPFSALLVVLFFALYPDAAFVPSLASVGTGLVVVLLAFVLRFLIQYTFAMASFWTERASAIEGLWALVYLFLSGVIAPLPLFPEWLQGTLHVLPFSSLVYLPTAILLGWPVDVAQGLAVLVGWIVVFAILNRVLWHQGLKRFSAMGA